ncbi:Ras family protein [Pelomyxa schiedti]|nr:Ras family protein [Pelomyxa schiedti]
MAATADPPKMTEHLLKVLVVGDMGTGKTSIISRYVYDCFSDQYKTTVGVDFSLKVLKWDEETLVRLQLWDIAGQERFGNMTRVYYKEASAAFIVFDITRLGTFTTVKNWKEDIDSKVLGPDGTPIPVVLIANKCDSDVWEKTYCVTKEELDQYVNEYHFVGWRGTSAKVPRGIDDASILLLGQALRQVRQVEDTGDEGGIVIGATTPEKTGGCC